MEGGDPGGDPTIRGPPKPQEVLSKFLEILEMQSCSGHLELPESLQELSLHNYVPSRPESKLALERLFIEIPTLLNLRVLRVPFCGNFETLPKLERLEVTLWDPEDLEKLREAEMPNLKEMTVVIDVNSTAPDLSDFERRGVRVVINKRDLPKMKETKGEGEEEGGKDEVNEGLVAAEP